MFFLLCMNVAATEWCKLEQCFVLAPSSGPHLRDSGNDAMRLNDPQQNDSRQAADTTLRIKRGSADRSKHCPSLLNGFSFHGKMQAHTKPLQSQGEFLH